MFKKWMCVFLSSFVLLSLPIPIALSAETLTPQTTAEKELVYGVKPDFKPTKGIFNSSMSLDKILTKDSLDLLESMGVSYINPDLSSLLIEIAEKEPERLKPILEDLAKEKEKTRNAFIEYVDKLYRPYGIHPEDKVSDYRTIAENYLKKRFGVDVHEDTVWKAFQKEHRIDVTEEFAQHQLENNYTREEAIARLYIEDGYEAEWGTLDTIFRDPKCADLRLRDTIFYEKDYKFEIYIPTLKAFLVDLGKTLHPKREEFYEHMGPYYAPRDFNRFYDYANESTESSSARQEKKRSKRHATKEPDPVNVVGPALAEQLYFGNGKPLIINGKKAQAYAEKWALSANPEYEELDSDCMNFVSQCLAAGGKFTAAVIPAHDFKDPKNITQMGSPLWWFHKKRTDNKTGKHYYSMTTTWIRITDFVTHAETLGYIVQHFLGQGAGEMVKTFVDPGDVLLGCKRPFFSSNHVPQHAVLVTKKDNNLTYCGHTNSRLHEPIDTILKSRDYNSFIVVKTAMP